jgi:hypothetical protein
MCGKNKHMHSSSNYPPKLLFITQEMDLGENLLQNPKSQRMEIMERKRGGEKSSSITLAQDMVGCERGKGSIYTWRGKPTSLGSMPSVHHQARDEIPRLGRTT